MHCAQPPPMLYKASVTFIKDWKHQWVDTQHLRRALSLTSLIFLERFARRSPAAVPPAAKQKP